MNENFTLTAFTEPITDLADQPNLPPEEMKRRLQAPAEELRLAHNALCDDTARLSDRVSGIITETFGDAIPKSMLADELQAEIDAKAEQADLEAEQTAREALAGAVAQKCEIYLGTYTGDGKPSQFIKLGFRPKAVLVTRQTGPLHDGLYYYGGLALDGLPVTAQDKNVLTVENTGFKVYYDATGNAFAYTNSTTAHNCYIAIR